MISDVQNVLNINGTYKVRVNSPSNPYLKHVQATDPSFVTITKPLSNKRGETFCGECVNFSR